MIVYNNYFLGGILFLFFSFITMTFSYFSLKHPDFSPRVPPVSENGVDCGQSTYFIRFLNDLYKELPYQYR